eukprot:GHVS01062143.1.p4 GENE.GHVS01062143.1~~GHVS01062143.1.p4  ORF type:complete len:108 (+),score=8.67 GHVS01062143.1:550-873(+)
MPNSPGVASRTRGALKKKNNTPITVTNSSTSGSHSSSSNFSTPQRRSHGSSSNASSGGNTIGSLPTSNAPSDDIDFLTSEPSTPTGQQTNTTGRTPATPGFSWLQQP